MNLSVVLKNLFFIFLFFMVSCDNQTCMEYSNNVFRPKHFSFIVEKKHQDGRNNVIEGLGVNGTYEIFNESGFFDLYYKVEIGDSIIKEKGKLSIKLIKKNKTEIFPCYCGGEIIE